VIQPTGFSLLRQFLLEKFRMLLNRIPVFLILCCAAAAAAAQSAAAPVTLPPVKMGLWESTITSAMSGFQLPPDVAAKLQAMGQQAPGGSHTVVTQSCLTPDQWQKDMERMNNPRDSDCTITNRQQDPKKLSFDISCKSQHGMTTSGHVEMNFVDDEHGHGMSHMKADNVGQNAQSITMDVTFETHRMGADCGDVQPGTPKVMNQPTQP
jgi:hypothetical protein